MLRRFQSFCADVLHVPAPPITAVVPQAVDDCAAIADASASTPSLRATIGVASDAVVVLLPCGLRRVKAPTFAVSVRAYVYLCVGVVVALALVLLPCLAFCCHSLLCAALHCVQQA
jgi:hypothetical protein